MQAIDADGIATFVRMYLWWVLSQTAQPCTIIPKQCMSQTCTLVAQGVLDDLLLPNLRSIIST